MTNPSTTVSGFMSSPVQSRGADCLIKQKPPQLKMVQSTEHIINTDDYSDDLLNHS